MISRWNEETADRFRNDPIRLRIYSSRLLGADPDLVLHGGGNTSVKTGMTDLLGDRREVLFIKGSGKDLATIDADGFAPLRLTVLRRLTELDRLPDGELVRIQRTALIDPDAPNPSVEAILHAIIPFRYVDHTHSDAVVTLTNTEDGETRIRELYGDRVLVVPYVHPGFELAKEIHTATRNVDWSRIEGLIVLKHGVFTFADDAKTSYERMIRLVSEAENVLSVSGCDAIPVGDPAGADLPALARIRRCVSETGGGTVTARLNQTPEACGFASLSGIESIVLNGPLAADHILRIGPFPAIITDSPEQDMADYAAAYMAYFKRHAKGDSAPLSPGPGWAVWPGHGTIAFGRSVREAEMVHEITAHTIRAIRRAEILGGWRGISGRQIFEMENWPLQRAKLDRKTGPPELQGKVALVTGAASGIGRACAEMLFERGAAVVGLDLNPEIESGFSGDGRVGICCDVTDDAVVGNAVDTAVRRFGGLDILIPNAGIFTASSNIETLDEEVWNRSLEINLSANQRLLKRCIPYLKWGLDAAVVFVASKNVPAPGPGAAAYSVAKAGLTQLARVAALELGPHGIRVNVIHPNAVYDTAIWTPEVLESRACHYGCTIEEYKTNNCLKTEVRSKDVAALVCAMVGPAFAKTTGAQIPIDGGNERVI